MNNPPSVSHLEALPAELFNRVLSYVFNPYDCEIEESNTTFGGYRFETSLLRISKTIHELAKSYVHHMLSWIRFDINWGAFAIQPHWLGVKYINIRHVKAAKTLPDEYLNLSLRPVPQEAPAGRLHIKIEFPHASDKTQEDVTRMVKSDANISMSLLVLEKDLPGFMQVLRMNDLAYCHRKFPGTTISNGVRARPGVHGMKSEIVIAHGQQLERYQHLILEFHVMWNVLHRTAITGHADSHLAKKSADFIQGQHEHQARESVGFSKADMNAKLPIELMGEGISSLLWLKHRGDEYLTKGLYASAYMCYSSACTLEEYWLKMAPPPANFTVWSLAGFLYVTFGVTLMFNMAIAKMKGRLDLVLKHPRGTSMFGYYGMLAILSGGGGLLDDQRYMELSMVAMIYEMLTEDLNQGDRLFDLVGKTWEDDDTIDDLSPDLGLLYDTVKELDDAEPTPASGPKSPDGLKAAVASGFANVAPLKWAVSVDNFPNPLREVVQFLPRVQLLPDGAVENPSGYSFQIPVYCQPTDEQRINGEDHPRYLV